MDSAKDHEAIATIRDMLEHKELTKEERRALTRAFLILLTWKDLKYVHGETDEDLFFEAELIREEMT